ncbi:hypothetical protein HYH03_007326 [Edaphochlamys debaryana]|uniref:Centrosomal protein of 19 kDa n=1 Tax=Edaphochlamys debaryana TaxID=47281 RepID=A0A836C0K2_9CHLO|nr:hypothetical protein HYH03_007326 [Edaphochlamys debaryana]|eukprot:KAG2494559.1 hypothetical protein HYH03_007326 [Edaphochlamys debaryana]
MPAPSGAPPEDTVAEGGYRAKRYAVKFQPPVIFLEYEDSSKKRRVRAVKLNGVQPSVDVDRLTKKVIRSFPRKLEAPSVKYDQVRKLVVKLLEYLAANAPPTANGGTGTAPSASGTTANGSARTSTSGRAPDAAHRTSSNGNVAAITAVSINGGTSGSMSSPLPTMSPKVDPRSPGGRLAANVHHGPRASVESTMSRFSTSTAGSSDDEDDLGGALDELDREMAGASASASGVSLSTRPPGGSLPESDSSRDSSFSFRDRPTVGTAGLGLTGAKPGGPAPSGGSVLDAGTPAGNKSRFAAEAEKLVIGFEVTDEVDLNKVTDLELKMAKQAMEQDFMKNQLKPGDPGYVYDKQVEFTPAAAPNDWDDSDDEEPAASEDPEVDWADIQAAVAKPAVAGGGAAGAMGGSSGDASPSRKPASQDKSPYNSNDWP